MKKRDDSIDFIKGMACLLMILAHSPMYFSGNEYVFLVIGGFAPVIFFAISGVTTTFQKNKSLIEFILFYFCFAVLGISYNLIWNPPPEKFLNLDIPQIIATSAIFIFILENFAYRTKKIYVILLSIVFITHVSIVNLESFPLREFFIVSKPFPLIPWMAFFFVGILAYKSSYKKNATMFFISSLSFIIYTLSFKNLVLSKWPMSIDYFLISLSLLFLTFYFMKRLRRYLVQRLIVYIGQNSFLFLFSHLLIIDFFKLVDYNQIFVVWITVTSLSVFLIIIIKKINVYIESIFNNFLSWVVITTVLLITPFVFHEILIVKTVAYVVGFLFASNLNGLKNSIANLSGIRIASPDEKA